MMNITKEERPFEVIENLLFNEVHEEISLNFQHISNCDDFDYY